MQYAWRTVLYFFLAVLPLFSNILLLLTEANKGTHLSIYHMCNFCFAIGHYKKLLSLLAVPLEQPSVASFPDISDAQKIEELR